MNYQKQMPDELISLLQNRGIKFFDYDYFAFPMVFGSTSGPRGGIGGSAMSTFTVEVYELNAGENTLYVCAGTYDVKSGRFPFEALNSIRPNWKKI